MKQCAPYEIVGGPLVGYIIKVPVSQEDDWLKLLREIHFISATPVHYMQIACNTGVLVDDVFVLVATEASDRPGLAETFVARSIRLVAEKLAA